MRFWPAAALSVCFLLPCTLPAQQPVPPQLRYERIWLVVPMVGSGTLDDPRRPLHVPLPPKTGAEREEAFRSGIIGFNHQVSDNGNFALVELVARNREAFRNILADRRPDIKVFERGKNSRAEVEAEFRRHRKDFDFDNFSVRVP